MENAYASPRGPRMPGAWAFEALLVFLAVASALAAWLGWIHIDLTHGLGSAASVCSFDGPLDCDAVNSSRWSELRNVPLSVWALPLYGVLGFWSRVARFDDERGRRARGGMLLISLFQVGVSLFLVGVMAFELGAWCLLCLGLDLVHVAIFGLVWMGGARRPSLPMGLDLIVALLVVVAVMGSGVKASLVAADRLDRVAAASLEQQGSEALPSTEVARAERDGRVIVLPEMEPRVPIDKKDPQRGAADATVSVVSFGDYQCGHCRRMHGVLTVLEDRYGDRVRFVHKHFPVDQSCNSRATRTPHPRACAAAIAAICAHRQGSFWTYHELLYRHPDLLQDTDLVELADRAGLDTERFDRCREDPTVTEDLIEDLSHAAFLEIEGTPVTFVQGRRFDGAVSESVLDAAIRLALGEAEEVDAGRVRLVERDVAEPSLATGPVGAVEVASPAGTVWVDRVEASVDADGRALSLAGVLPARASWFEARDACAAAGRRLCTQAEWLSACQGAPAIDDDADGDVLDDYREGRSHPYADGVRDGWCHVAADRTDSDAVATGTWGACRTPDGIYDLAGNLQEWVGASAEEAALVGGTWYGGDYASCGARNDSFGPGLSNRTTGFRCCADSEMPIGAETGVGDVAAGEVTIATTMPAFTGLSPGGDPVGNSVIEGKVAVVNFWASWCAPCRKELPILDALHAELSGRGFTVLGVGLDREPARAKALLERVPVGFPVLLDPDASLAGHFGVAAMPTTVLVAADGRVVEVHSGFDEAWLGGLRDTVLALLDEG